MNGILVYWLLTMYFPLQQVPCFRNRRIHLSPNNPASKTCERFCSNLLHFEVQTLELQLLSWRLISITKRKMAHFPLAIKRVLIMLTFRKHYRWYRKLLNIHGNWNVPNLGIPFSYADEEHCKRKAFQIPPLSFWPQAKASLVAQL